MTPEDLAFIRRLLAAGKIASPCLELGAGYGGPSCKVLLENARIDYCGTDLAPGAGVDYVANFEDDPETVAKVFASRPVRFQSALILNVLEHTFDPICVLDNVVALLAPRGTCVVIVPAVWPLHDFPLDCWRTNPHFFEEYARRRGLTLDADYFEYVGFGRVRDYRINGHYCLPTPRDSSLGGLYSRVVHRIFNTRGRGMATYSFIALGALFTKP